MFGMCKRKRWTKDACLLFAKKTLYGLVRQRQL